MSNLDLTLFNERLPHKPYYSDDLQFGVKIASKKQAMLAKYIQFNQPHAQFWLGFDVDRQGAALDWYDLDAPAPNFSIMNPENGHAHLLYGLETAIRTAPDSRIKPLKYAAAVENALRKKLDADIGYSGLICKNPNNKHWQVNIWQKELYSLGWLADYLDFTYTSDLDIISDYGLGRNCQLFDKTRQWAYKTIRQDWPIYEVWFEKCFEQVEKYNYEFLIPLNYNEVFSIAKSIAKWTFSKFNNESFSDYVKKTHSSNIQSKRGRKGGRPSLGSPWLELGISRSTYFRRVNFKK